MEDEELEHITDGGKSWCPKCGDPMPVYPTSYGFRMICAADGIRWTRIRGEAEWHEETYSPMAENRKER